MQAVGATIVGFVDRVSEEGISRGCAQSLAESVERPPEENHAGRVREADNWLPERGQAVADLDVGDALSALVGVPSRPPLHEANDRLRYPLHRAKCRHR